jgi:hypothetical protein
MGKKWQQTWQQPSKIKHLRTKPSGNKVKLGHDHAKQNERMALIPVPYPSAVNAP